MRQPTHFSMRALLPSFLFFFVLGCATYQSKVSVARNLLQSRSAEGAVKELEPLARQDGKDQLLYVLDLAIALQEAGRFKESAAEFARAEKIADLQDYQSVSRVAGSLALSEEMVQYKGENFEKLLINVLNSVNFLALNDLDGALVEVRRINIRLNKYRLEEKRGYEQNPFAFYLSGLIWEADRKWDDAYIAYKNAFDIKRDFTPLRTDLIRSALRAQRPDELDSWKKKFPEVKIRSEWKDSNMGEIVLIYQQGWGPRKQARPDNHRFPMLVPVRNTSAERAKLTIKKQGLNDVFSTAFSEEVLSIEDLAIKTFEDDIGRLITSRLAGIATKAVLADQLRQRDNGLGQLAWVVMNVADRADLRQWSTLPRSLQIARQFVPAGNYSVEVEAIAGLNPIPEATLPIEVQVKPGRKSFLSWRSYQ